MNQELPPRVRTVLDAPRGRRFSRAATPPARRQPIEAKHRGHEKALLEQRHGNPWGGSPRHGRSTARQDARHPRSRRLPPPALGQLRKPRRRTRQRWYLRWLSNPVVGAYLELLSYALAITAGALIYHLGTYLV